MSCNLVTSAGSWAGLRAATPLAQNDGLNFLRLGRRQPFGFHNFEIGNEEYGSWEVDHHGEGGDTGVPHDPLTYALFAKKFSDYAALVDPSISIGWATERSRGLRSSLARRTIAPRAFRCVRAAHWNNGSF